MPKKKNKPNAFLLFMLDYKSKQESKGHPIRGMAEVQRAAGQIWDNMNAEERAPFAKKAKEAKASCWPTNERLTSLGVPIKQVEAEKHEAESKTNLISSRIISLIDDAVQNNVLEQLEVYFISFGYFCVLSDGRYIPAELGVVRYSLEKGVMDKCHMLIDPGELPIGMAWEAQQHSANDHQLPVPPNALGEKNFETIALKLFKFLTMNGSDMPLLFTASCDIAKVETMLKDVLSESIPDLDLLVCPLSELFFQLKKASMQVGLSVDSGYPSVHVAQSLLTKDIYDYTDNISCDFHEKKGIGKFCALSRCVRWAFTISDSCCLDLSIELQRGKHLPGNANTEWLVPMGSTSYVSSQADKMSFVSHSHGSCSTYPTVASTSYCSTPSELRGKPSRLDGYTNTRANSGQGQIPSLAMADHQQMENISALQETLKTESVDNAWGGPTARMTPTAGRGSIQALQVARSTVYGILGAGRGRKPTIDDFPPLGSDRKTFK